MDRNSCFLEIVKGYNVVRSYFVNWGVSGVILVKFSLFDVCGN